MPKEGDNYIIFHITGRELHWVGLRHETPEPENESQSSPEHSFQSVQCTWVSSGAQMDSTREWKTREGGGVGELREMECLKRKKALKEGETLPLPRKS